MRNTLTEEKLKEKFECGDKEKKEAALRDAADWLNKNQLAETDKFRGGGLSVALMCDFSLQRDVCSERTEIAVSHREVLHSQKQVQFVSAFFATTGARCRRIVARPHFRQYLVKLLSLHVVTSLVPCPVVVDGVTHWELIGDCERLAWRRFCHCSVG